MSSKLICFRLAFCLALIAARTSLAQSLDPISPLHFTKIAGESNPLPQVLRINGKTPAISFTLSAATNAGGPWLAVSAATNTTPSLISVSISADALAPGFYQGSISLTAAGQAAVNVPVTLNVLAADSRFLDSLPGGLTFTARPGALFAPQTFLIREKSASAYPFRVTTTASDGGLWLRVSVALGSTPWKATASIDTTLLPNAGATEGVFSGSILIETAAGNYTIPVSVEITNTTLSQVHPLFFTMKQGGPNPLAQFAALPNISGTVSAFSVSSVVSRGGSWLQAAATGPNQQSLRVSVNSASTLASGTYTGQFLLTGGAPSRPALVVPVTLSVLPSLVLSDVPGGLYFNLRTGAGSPPPQTFPLRLRGSAQFSWHAENIPLDGTRWLTAYDSGNVEVFASVDVSRLPGGGQTPGVFTAYILVDSEIGEYATIPVVVTVGDAHPQQLQPMQFSRASTEGPPLSQWPLVLSHGPALFFTSAFRTSAGGPWLEVTPAGAAVCCAMPQVLRVRILDAPTLAAGTYTGQVEIAASAVTQVVPVVLTVLPSNVPRFDRVPGQLSFSGTTTSGPLAPQMLSVRNPNNGLLSWSPSFWTSDNGFWLGFDPSGGPIGSGDGNLIVTVNRAQLPNGGTVAGTYQGQVMLQSTSAGVVTVPVSVVIGEAFQPTSPVTFSASSSNAALPAQTVAVGSTTGTAIAFNGLVETGRGGNWLQAARVGPACCTTPESVTLSVTPAGLPADTYLGQYVAYRDRQAMVTPVRLNVGSLRKLLSLDLSGPYILVPGATIQITAVARWDDSTSGTVTRGAVWSSSNPAVATVGANTGVVTGVSAGRASISATFEGITNSYDVTVNATGVNIVDMSSFIASPGETITITGAGFNPERAQVWISGFTIENAALVSKSATRIVFTVPNNVTPDTYFVTVRNTDTGAISNSMRLDIGPRAAGGSHFTPITPCRVADTRLDIPAGIPGNSFRNFDLRACVPFYATAVAVNVTLVPKGPFGFLSIWPAGQPQPVVSTMNSLDGRIKANAAVVGLGTNRQISVYVTEEANVILDVSGYFLQAGDPRAYAFYPVTPCRVLDTRTTGGVIAAKGTRNVSGGCLPTNGPRGYSLNVTVVPPAPLGFLTLWPDGLPQPTVSTLNNLTGTVVANAALLEPGNRGSFNAYVTDESHMIVDLNGYFRPSGEAGALTFYPVTPCRILDTRNANGAFGGPRMAPDAQRDFNVPASNCGIPATAKAYVVNATVVPSGVFGFLTLWPAGAARPTVSTLNAVDGALTSNAAIVPAGVNGAISAYTSDGTHLLLDISGYFAP